MARLLFRLIVLDRYRSWTVRLCAGTMLTCAHETAYRPRSSWGHRSLTILSQRPMSPARAWPIGRFVRACQHCSSAKTHSPGPVPIENDKAEKESGHECKQRSLRIEPSLLAAI